MIWGYPHFRKPPHKFLDIPPGYSDLLRVEKKTPNISLKDRPAPHAQRRSKHSESSPAKFGRHEKHHWFKWGYETLWGTGSIKIYQVFWDFTNKEKSLIISSRDLLPISKSCIGEMFFQCAVWLPEGGAYRIIFGMASGFPSPSAHVTRPWTCSDMQVAIHIYWNWLHG